MPRVTDSDQASRGLAVVTGASSGIGRAFARNLARRGHPLLVVGRRAERLERLAGWARAVHGVEVRVVVADLTSVHGVEMCRQAVDNWAGAIDVAVLNAGVGSRGPFHLLPGRAEADMARVNGVAVIDLATHVVPRMVAARRGALVVVSSAAAFQPVPNMATYAATKAFELHWLRAVAHELRGSGVRAVAVCPGPCDTEFSTGAGGDVVPRMIPRERPETVVRATWRALAAGRTVVAVGAVARAARVANVVLPERAVVAVAAVLHRRKGMTHAASNQ